ncbi:short chain dehydrogenase [Ceratobasidium sp. AG-Ba]|nr:short chain dehydrogenase [Ceratobasidium sp. AG-Ba]QRW04299.1 short chain dehydrogenase [Ceratobasidium sp. AG-Ba]
MATTTSGKVIIVTGASSGIGRATAITLSKGGWRVVLVARREAELNAAAQECPTDTLVVAGDVTDEAFAEIVFEKAVHKFGRVDALFNNAGISAPSVPIDELSVDDFRRVIDVNLVSAFIFTRQAFKIFKSQTPQGGSISAYTPRPMSVPYTASKHATSGLTKSTSLDGRNFNIACTQIDIGNAQTQMVARQGNEGALQPNGQRLVEDSFDVQHVANTILHIANLPLDVTVLFMNIMATGMPFVGRG